MSKGKPIKKRKPVGSNIKTMPFTLKYLTHDEKLYPLKLLVRQNLKIGDEFTYDELAVLLNLEKHVMIKQSIKARMKQLTRLFSYEEKDNGKFLITEIYKKPKPPLPRSISSNNKYTPALAKCILSFLDNKENNMSTCTSQEWWYYLGMSNFNLQSLSRFYIDCTNSIIAKLDANNIYYFYNIISQYFIQHFCYALKRLEENEIIKTSPSYIIKKQTEDIYRKAKDREVENIRRYDKKVIKQLQSNPNNHPYYLSSDDVTKEYNYLSHKSYYIKLQSILSKELNIEWFHKATTITLGSQYTKYSTPITIPDRINALQNINNLFINLLNQHIQTFYNKHKITIGEGYSQDNQYNAIYYKKLYPKFLHEQSYLIDKCIVCSTEMLSDIVNNYHLVTKISHNFAVKN